MLTNLLIILLFNFVVITILWLSSLKTQRADFIDIYWGPSFFISFLLLLYVTNKFSNLNLLTICLIGAWGFRLGIYLLKRNINKAEDIRYVKIRELRGNVGLYFTAYLIQILLIPIISLPMISMISAESNFNLFSFLGLCIAISGIIIESVADYQLSKFKSKGINNDKVMNEGLWHYSRHPNYFGDTLFWWGLTLFCFSISNNLIIFVSPIIMTYLLLKVSGVTMLENRLSKKKEGYDDYMRTTSSFIILPKKKNVTKT